MNLLGIGGTEAHSGVQIYDSSMAIGNRIHTNILFFVLLLPSLLPNEANSSIRI